MVSIKRFTFNPVSVNTYVVWDETKQCLLVDVGCCNEEEFNRLELFIKRNELKPVKLINTHGHFDHVWGTKLATGKWGIDFSAHKSAELTINLVSKHSAMFGFDPIAVAPISSYIEDGDEIPFGDSKLVAYHVPGHSPGSIVYYSADGEFVITGDVLFKGSVGRTDFEYGDSALLISGIKSKVITLPDNTVVYPGHGASSTIIDEKSNNPFIS